MPSAKPLLFKVAVLFGSIAKNLLSSFEIDASDLTKL